jgi:hypothetical protein
MLRRLFLRDVRQAPAEAARARPRRDGARAIGIASARPPEVALRIVAGDGPPDIRCRLEGASVSNDACVP